MSNSNWFQILKLLFYHREGLKKHRHWWKVMSHHFIGNFHFLDDYLYARPSRQQIHQAPRTQACFTEKSKTNSPRNLKKITKKSKKNHRVIKNIHREINKITHFSRILEFLLEILLVVLKSFLFHFSISSHFYSFGRQIAWKFC